MFNILFIEINHWKCGTCKSCDSKVKRVTNSFCFVAIRINCFTQTSQVYIEAVKPEWRVWHSCFITFIELSRNRTGWLQLTNCRYKKRVRDYDALKKELEETEERMKKMEGKKEKLLVFFTSTIAILRWGRSLGLHSNDETEDGWVGKMEKMSAFCSNGSKSNWEGGISMDLHNGDETVKEWVVETMMEK